VRNAGRKKNSDSEGVGGDGICEMEEEETDGCRVC
jgi:hypothetical protein